jgi:hypothetical protein
MSVKIKISEGHLDQCIQQDSGEPEKRDYHGSDRHTRETEDQDTGCLGKSQR